jgi:hydrogenase/urease accessory protein HupE
MNKIIAAGYVLVASLIASPTSAHPGIHGEENFVAGMTHQFTQADHLNTFLVAAFGVLLTGVVLLMQRKGAKAKK